MYCGGLLNHRLMPAGIVRVPHLTHPVPACRSRPVHGAVAEETDQTVLFHHFLEHAHLDTSRRPSSLETPLGYLKQVNQRRMLVSQGFRVAPMKSWVGAKGV